MEDMTRVQMAMKTHALRINRPGTEVVLLGWEVRGCLYSLNAAGTMG
jgi:hypothetical protein